MKALFSYKCASVLGVGLLMAGVAARASITVEVSNSYSGLTISPSAGSLTFLGGLQSSAFAQAGANGDYDSGAFSGAGTSDTPVPGGMAFGGASGGNTSGVGLAYGMIPGTVAGYDTSEGQGSTYGAFEITGVTGPVNVNFSAALSGEITLSSDNNGVEGRGEAVFTLSVDDNVVLGYDDLQTIGPDQTTIDPFSQTLSDSMSLMGGTPYYLYAQADSEALVANSNASVPDSMQGPLMAVTLAVSFLMLTAFKGGRNRKILPALALFSVGFIPASRATYIGADAPDICKTCGAQPTRQPAGTVNTSITEGNLREDYPVVTIKSSYGPTLSLSFTYNSYNADGSRAQLDTGMGYGWTFTGNTLLFQQRGQLFKLGEDGRVTHYNTVFGGSTLTYVSDSGYFETITQQTDGTYYLTNKYQSWWHFGSVPNTPFYVGGPVYRLTQSGDRNGNTTSYGYNANGNLQSISDPYGRTIQFTYNHNHIVSVTDPMGRPTTFTYDAQGRVPIQITDPLGRTIQYTYNAQYQITRKMDRDGRMYFYTYRSQLPYMVTDGTGEPYFSMSNFGNWAVNATNLAYSLKRQYIPGTTSSTDGRGNTWQYQYDVNGYITQSVAPDGAIRRWTYDPGTLQVASRTDADGNVTHWTYDADGNRISSTDPLGDTTTWTYDPNFNQITSMTDPLNRVTEWTYDDNGNMLSQKDPLGQTQTWTYDSHGNVLTHTDNNGYSTTNSYNSYGERISSVDPLGNTTQWTYDAVGNILSMTDPLGRTTEWTSDALDRQIGMTNALGGVTTWTYDPAGNVLTATDPDGNTTTWQYDDRSRMIETIDPLGGTTQWTYDADNNRITSTTPNGNVTTNGYDLQNRKIEKTDPLGGTTRWTYDSQGNILSSTDPDDNATHWTYDPLNRMIGSTNALGGVTLYYYSMVGSPACCTATPGTSLLMEMQDADGNITYYHYDELDRRIQIVRKNSDTNNDINPTDAVTTTTYDPDNNIVSMTDPNGNTTTWAYDADDRKITMVNAAGDTTRWSYDADGNVLTTTSPNLNATTNGYDALNRVITQYDAIGLVRSNSYDADGNLLSTVDGLGHTTSYTYDGLNRQVTTTDGLGHTTSMAYDADSNTISTTDRNGHITTYTYDALDRRVRTIDALGDTTQRVYDADGNLISLIDANGHATTYTYDALNRQITETFPDSPPNTKTTVYDAVGNIIETIDQNGQVTQFSFNRLYYMTNRAYSPSGSLDQFTYDDGGRLLSANRNGWLDTYAYDGANRLTNTVQNGRTLTYAYDIAGRTQTNTQPSGRTLNYTYDARNHLVTLADGTPNPPIVTYTYDVANRVVNRSLRNNTTTIYTYDAVNRITTLNHTNASGIIAGFNYAYDNEGNKLYEQKVQTPANSEAYAYDAINRLTNYDVGTLSGTTIPSPTIAKFWTLDAVGNWLTIVSNATIQTRTYSPSDELLTINTSTFTYDHNGNVTNDTVYAYSYDEENRLIQVQRLSDSAVVGQYAYDAMGRRISHLANPSGIPSTNLYFYDGWKIIEEDTPANLLIATYTYGNYVDETLTMDRGGHTYYYHPNGLWSIEAVTDNSGNPVERYSYDAYGAPTVMDGNYNPLPPNPWGTAHSAITNFSLFTGRQLDEEDALYFYRARYDDTVKGRFLERDPVGYLAGMNQYEYVNGRPTISVDPTGLYNDWNCCPGLTQYWKRRGYASEDACIKASGGDFFEGAGMVPGFLGPLAGGIGAGGKAGYWTAVLQCRNWECTSSYAPTIVSDAGRSCWSLWSCREVKLKCRAGDGLYSGTSFGAQKPSGQRLNNGVSTWLCY